MTNRRFCAWLLAMSILVIVMGDETGKLAGLIMLTVTIVITLILAIRKML
ncbi:hypothetical protein AH03_69 [Erwinia phage AH03]|uniref:Uncharacterized protein n=1 Tax=Erwinia phage AH03 TaxID=2869568 RepID=A0AAE7X1A8_9CAUD|nr:hypothetical protein AH03_69 [Erwinia phage AH03]